MRPDILTAGKGTTSGYVPFGFAAANGEVFDAVARSGFVHGFTWSHNALGAAVGRAVLSPSHRGGLSIGAPTSGNGSQRTWRRRFLDDAPSVGDVRGLRHDGRGSSSCATAGTKEPFRRADQATERIVGAPGRGPFYSPPGHVDGADGDLVMLGPPFCLTDEEADLIDEGTAAAIRSVV